MQAHDTHKRDPSAVAGDSPHTAPQGSIDYWDLSQVSAAPPSGVGETIDLQNTPGKKDVGPVTVIAIFLVFAALSYLAWEYFETGENPLTGIWATLMEPEPKTQPFRPKPVVKPIVNDEVVPVNPRDPEPVVNEAVAGNPYWILPNFIDGDRLPLSRNWTSEEEEFWRAGLTNNYTYQRYKTVQDVRQRQLRGSEVILWDALQEPKFWTRMWAAIGLAEFNVEVSLQSVEIALGPARSELVSNFFKRFIKKSSHAQRFLMRQAIRLIDARGRLTILQALDRNTDKFRDLYMVAALQDPAYRIRAFAENALRFRGVSPERFQKLLAVVNGSVDGKDLFGEPQAVLAAEEEKVDDLKEFESEATEVKFYEDASDGTEIESESDYETFEVDDTAL